MSKVLAIAQYTVHEALRTRLAWIVLITLCALGLIGLFVAQVAITETARLQAGFLAATGRMGAIFLVCLHVSSSMGREFNDKGTELLLSLDLPRASYYLGKLTGFSAVALGIAAATTIPLACFAPLDGVLLWGASLACELVLVAAFTLFCVVSFVQIMPAASFVLAFYLLARSIAAIQLIAGSQLLAPHTWLQQAARWMIAALGLLLPDLARFTQTAWLLNGTASTSALALIALQTLIYTVLLTSAGLFDLYRKSL